MLDRAQVWMLVLHRYLEKQNASVPFPVHFAGQVGLLTFVLLMLMPTHPLTIPASFGGALSLSLLPVLFGSLRPLTSIGKSDALNQQRDKKKLHRLASLSKWAAIILVVLVIQHPDLTLLPFQVLFATLTLFGIFLLLCTVFRTWSRIDRSSILDNIFIASCCILTTALLLIIPTGTGLLVTAAYLAAGFFLVVFMICWVLALVHQLAQSF